jgi:hypothetical protein
MTNHEKTALLANLALLVPALRRLQDQRLDAIFKDMKTYLQWRDSSKDMEWDAHELAKTRDWNHLQSLVTAIRSFRHQYRSKRDGDLELFMSEKVGDFLATSVQAMLRVATSLEKIVQSIQPSKPQGNVSQLVQRFERR